MRLTKTIPWNKGKKMSSEQRNKLSAIAKKNKRKPPLRKGKSPWNKGKKGLQKAWNKGLGRDMSCIDCGNNIISRSLKVKRCRKCYLHYFRNVISKSTKYKLKLSKIHKKRWKKIPKKENKRYIHVRNKKYINWRMKVFKRDNFTCRECGKTDCYIEAHHIKSWAKFPKLRYHVKNGLTLCSKCHNHSRNKLKLLCLN